KLDETLEPDTLPTEGRMATPFDRRPSTLPPTAAGAPATPFEAPLMPRTGKRHAKVAHDLLCYAELYVAREREPERRAEIEARYQVRDARASAALDELWELRFSRDPDLREAWEITLRTLRIRDSGIAEE
ncbi:MAG TPA: hypothetical protein VFB62_00050, partial [Polyangiaceae bacterium]|nr:hypothetical protein [Polyangiaceae bacterium]